MLPRLFLLLNSLLIVHSVRIPIGAIFQEDSLSEEDFQLALNKHQAQTELFELYSIHLKEIQIPLLVEKMCSLVSKGAMGIFLGQFSASKETMNMVVSAAEAFKVPVFMLDYPSTEDEPNLTYSYAVHMRPSLTDVTVAWLQYNNWTNFSYITSSAEGLYRLDQIVRKMPSISPNNVDIRYVENIIDSDSVTPELKALDDHLDSKTGKNVILDMDSVKRIKVRNQTPELQNLLNNLIRLGMNRRDYNYLICSYDVRAFYLEGFKYSGVHLSGFQLNTTGEYNPSDYEVQSPTYESRQALYYDALLLMADKAMRILKGDHSRKNYQQMLAKAKDSLDYASRYLKMNAELDSCLINGADFPESLPFRRQLRDEIYSSINPVQGETGLLSFGSRDLLRNDYQVDIVSMKP
ncbi:hypothetical protein Ciccas_002007 [Cichlidogyrus casuarinus]|uniref:Receptor ligand binding region domain-containing protein n=1 Tax=Cichlidogyrus casuarinus TaxID=1844966 RepID=A0ABD2QIP9_9PLAT